MISDGKLEKIINWAKSIQNIRALLLTGSRASKGPVDELSDYDLAVFGNDFDFINDDEWLNQIED